MELNKETIKKILDDIDLSAGPPEEEPARQYYFMASARRRLREQFAEDIASGEALKRYGAEELAAMEAEGVCGTAAVITFGCQMNAKDAEKFRGILECIEYKMRESEDADLILVLDKGRVIERGTHRELLANNGFYRHIWAIQNSKEEGESIGA